LMRVLMKRGTLVAAIVCSVLVSDGFAVSGEKRISCFLLGSVTPGICPLPHFFSEDPLFTYVADWQPSGLTLEERRKMDRLYYPRSREVFSEKYDMVFFYDPRIDHFTTKQFADLEYVCREAGMPSLWALSHGAEMWYTATVFDVLPISTIPLEGYFHRPWRVAFREGREPVFTPFVALGMESVVGEAYAGMEPRQGAVVWADIEPAGTPWLASWKVDLRAGLSWATADEFDVTWWGLARETRGSNPYAIDLVTNLVLCSLDRDLVQDVLARRDARGRISTFRSKKLVVIAMLEWADSFGANTLSLSESLTGLDGDVGVALDYFLDQEYDASISLMDGVSVGLDSIAEQAVRLKDEALFWVFVLEWLVVTSTAMIAGFVIWSLMIRRRIYRAVGTTRLQLAY